MTPQSWLARSLLVSPRGWGRYVAAGGMTLLAIIVVGILWRRLEAIPDPGLMLLFTVAAATYLAGGMAGMLSAAIVLFCSFLLFSHPVYPFRYTELDWRQMMAIVVACPIIALMVGSLREQVERLGAVTREAELMQGELRRLEIFRESQWQCEQRFRLLAECLPGYALCTLDAGGAVKSWNRGAERLFGYPDPEIVGQSFSRFFTKEDLLARQPERLLEQARFSGRAVEEEGWRLKKGGARFRAHTTLLAITSSSGAPAGALMIVRDLSSELPASSAGT